MADPRIFPFTFLTFPRLNVNRDYPRWKLIYVNFCVRDFTADMWVGMRSIFMIPIFSGKHITPWGDGVMGGPYLTQKALTPNPSPRWGEGKTPETG